MRIAAAAISMLVACASPIRAEAFHVVPGRVPLDWQGPDGNTIVLDAPDGLIVFDTGRSPQHAQTILDYAKATGRPIVAVVNSHWHLDHTTGNEDIRQAYKHVRVFGSAAIEGALVGFLNQNRAQSDKLLADPKTPTGQKAQIMRGRSRIDHPETLRPTDPITKSGQMSIGGRMFDVHLAKFAATEGDVWIYDRKTHVAIVGDLVVGLVPFMDTACPDGWSNALDAIAAVPFRTLVPGHGDVMDRTDFMRWRAAYNEFVRCGRSTVPKSQCASEWESAAARFIPPDHRQYVREAADYYIDTRLRSSTEEQQRFCKSLKPS